MTLDPRLLSIPSARPTPGPMIPYQHQYQQESSRNRHDSPDSVNVFLPRRILAAIPSDVVHATNIARRRADEAYRGFLFLQHGFNQRFYRLCPNEPRVRTSNHAKSIDMLFSWGPKSGYTADPPKIPTCAVKFYVEEDAYLKYAHRYRSCRQKYLNGVYLAWIKSDIFLRNFADNTPMSAFARARFNNWWTGYRDEMRTWEEQIDSLVLPSWASIVRELREIIEERLDLDKEWDRWV
ncbi:uncharacterized protein ARB_04921 [Trichophyton benhamiae CBS 112371]|uniref:Uncharacterized protein n=1 Tax=Arthroderma benhamiae (strain ATCC MYA-4681 / CBS 112371) TaxID=663331 RepID=D4AKS6_ARTBC|nr:uncharacterized protein ARB_04921 [Trichophyton benhamiae CBS 112371]EFE35985.1 hypothetical protein ARB_04921 [Trichophyton benhamiae CBS 112371]